MNNYLIKIIVYFVGYVYIMALINMRKMEHVKELYSFYLMMQIALKTILLQCTAPFNYHSTWQRELTFWRLMSTIVVVPHR